MACAVGGIVPNVHPSDLCFCHPSPMTEQDSSVKDSWLDRAHAYNPERSGWRQIPEPSPRARHSCGVWGAGGRCVGGGCVISQEAPWPGTVSRTGNSATEQPQSPFP